MQKRPVGPLCRKKFKEIDSFLREPIALNPNLPGLDHFYFKATVGAIYIGAAKSIGAALFAAVFGHLKKTFLFFIIIYCRMLRIRILKKKLGKSFFWGPYF